MTDTRLSVLVVDDDPDTADTLADFLNLTGHRARAAHGGVVAQRLAAAEWPDVVVLDLAMPGVDGWELAHRLHPPPPAPRPFLIAVTGFSGPDARERAREAGIDLFLVKPVPLDALERVLQRFRRVLAPSVGG
jgi:CheY-like chemotaxis protein